MRHVPAVLLAATIAVLVAGLSRIPAGHPSRFRDRATGIEFVLIPAQTFDMGTLDGVAGRAPQEVRHRVSLTRSYYLGRHEVTQAQWVAVTASNPSHFTGCDRCPVEGVNFFEIEEFIRRMNVRPGPRYRLPTEAEWELGCRAGGDGLFGGGSTLTSGDANIDGNYPYGGDVGPSRGRTTPVGAFPPNAWGLFDMSGNVWEWVQDWHCPYAQAGSIDPVGACESPFRVIRGGSWKFDGNSARCGLRYTHRPQDRGYSLGFRLARDVD
jgi:formylglycine-generating enzyme required for sulfatase activity